MYTINFKIQNIGLHANIWRSSGLKEYKWSFIWRQPLFKIHYASHINK